MPTKKPAVVVQDPPLPPGTFRSDYPWLYYLSSKGALHRWRVWCVDDTVFTEYGQVDGKHQKTPGKKCRAMFAGQKNARSPEQQAAFTAEAMHNFKLNRKYSLTPEGAGEQSNLPMLAQRFDERPHKIQFPCDGQPKLDGNRAAARWEGADPVLVSRSGIENYDLSHITDDIAKILPKGAEFDGELYVHGTHPNTINSWVEKQQPESKQVEYWIYDFPIVEAGDTGNLRWHARRRRLLELFGIDTCTNQAIVRRGSLVIVPTYDVLNPDQVNVRLEEALAAGFEGLMLRNLDGRYEWGHRSNDLQKVKVFEDAEFEVTGCGEGVGKMAGCAVFRCKTKDGKAFDCTCKVPMAERKKQYTDRAKYIGRMLTVSFFGYFLTGIPRFPRGLKFRLPKDT